MFKLKSPNLGPLNRPLRFIRRQLPPLNFITIHYIYFIGTCLLFGIIFWGSSTPAHSVSFTDSLFLAVSAMTLAGLNTVNLSTLNSFQQILLFILIMLGSAIFVSAFVVHVRRAAFEQKFKAVIEERRQKRGRTWERGRTWARGRRSTEDHREGENIGESEKQISDNEPANGFEKRDNPDPSSFHQRRTLEMDGITSTTEGNVGQIASQDDSQDRFSPKRENTAAGITFSPDTRFEPPRAFPRSLSRRPSQTSLFSMQGVGARPSSSLRVTGSAYRDPDTTMNRSASSFAHPKSRGEVERYFDTVEGWIGRNSQFHGLTAKEREALGGCEYRAVSLLAWLVPAYFVLWQLLGCLGCAAWVAHNRPSIAQENGLDPWWVGAFNAVSAFNNSGMSLLDMNMIAFQTSYYMLITMGLLILAGNTCYPIFLRLIVWCMHKVSSRLQDRSRAWSQRASTLRFLLDHPRRCYTNLFPSQHTWWLLVSVITLNGVDWAGFEILNIGNKQLDESNPTNIRVIDGLFQAFAVRSGGFYVVPIPSLRISLQVLYVVMMYISVYPVVITMRNSNVYEERSLGIYSEDVEEKDDGTPAENDNNAKPEGTGRLMRTLAGHFLAGGANTGESNGHFVRQQLRAQLAHDAWWIVLAVFLVMIVEGSQFNRDPAVFSVFNFIFEIVSAYGCVGISVGVPWADYSFCGTWHVLSKLILCAVMIRGRHRGLPVAIDRAVLLPGEENGQAEEDDGRIRMARTLSRRRSDVALV